jgi:hypothetical protein
MSAREKWISKFLLKGKTWVFVPNGESIAIGVALKEEIESQWKIPHNYFHLKDGGHIAALQHHTKNNCFLRLDIDNFFGQINRSRITRHLKDYYPYKEARRFAMDSTVKDPDADGAKYILPFGFVQSPILASICLRKSALGTLLSRISNHSDFTCTVYMDDILISCVNEAGINNKLVEQLEATARRSGFPLSAKKREGPAFQVTAFNISLSHGSLTLTEKRMNEFKEVFFESHNERQKYGILKYVDSIDPSQALALLGV